MQTKNLTWKDVESRAKITAGHILGEMIHRMETKTCRVYPIPRGGIPAAQAVLKELVPHNVQVYLIENPEDADIYVDDVIDSGNTRFRYFREYGEKPFFALVDKQKDKTLEWISFPWERMYGEDVGIEENIRRILQYVEGSGLDSSISSQVFTYGRYQIVISTTD